MTAKKRSEDLSAEELRQRLSALAASGIDELDLERELDAIRGSRKLSVVKSEYLKIQRELNESQAENQENDGFTKKDERVIEKRSAEISFASNILELFQKSLKEHKGYVADYLTAGTIFVSHIARLLPKSSGFLIDGGSGSGKSDLVMTGAEYLPPENVIYCTSLSPKALYRMGNLAGTYMVGGEIQPLKPGEDDSFQVIFRQFISENCLTAITCEQTKDGNWVHKTYTVSGPVAFMLTTTAEANSFQDEFFNRLSVCHTNETETATETVLNEIASRVKRHDPEKEAASKREIEAFRKYHRQLKSYRVDIPFSREIIPSSRSVTTRRLFTMIISYVRAVALAHQETRATTETGSIEATPEDYKIAYQLLSACAPVVNDEVGDRGRSFFDRLVTNFKGAEFTRGDVQSKMKDSDASIKRFIPKLERAGAVEFVRKDGKKAVYKIGTMPKPARQDLGLVHPDQLIGSKVHSVQSGGEPEYFNPSKLGLDPKLVDN